MSYQVRRIDVFWITHPLVFVLVLAGLAVAGVGYQRGSLFVTATGGVLASIGIFMAAKPRLSVLIATLSLAGGFVTFFLVPNPSVAGTSAALKLWSLAAFVWMYTTLMDAMLLAVSALYNFYGTGLGLEGIALELSEDAEETPGV